MYCLKDFNQQLSPQTGKLESITTVHKRALDWVNNEKIEVINIETIFVKMPFVDHYTYEETVRVWYKKSR